jgi:hypothetical protein
MTKVKKEMNNINLHIMDRTGDTQLVVTEDTALVGKTEGDATYIDRGGARDAIVKEFGRGKWLRVVRNSGDSETITDVTDLTPERMDGIFADAFELGMFNAIVGG